MSAFQDSAHARQVLDGYYAEEAASDEHMLAGSGVVMAYNLENPTLRIVLDGSAEPRPGKSFAYSFDDPNAPKPTVEFSMDADTFDKVHRGEAQPMVLMMTGKVKTKGDVTAAARLLPAMARAIPRYKKYRETH